MLQHRLHPQQHPQPSYHSYLSRTNSPRVFDYRLLAELMEFASQSDTDNWYVLLGNYLLDHPEALGFAFSFFRNRFSGRRHYAWVVRLAIEADGVDPAEYLWQLDQFIMSGGMPRV